MISLDIDIHQRYITYDFSQILQTNRKHVNTSLHFQVRDTRLQYF